MNRAPRVIALLCTLALGACFRGSSTDEPQPPSVEEVTSSDLVAALERIAPYVVEHGLVTGSGGAPVPLAQAAALVGGGGVVLLSTGRAADAGAGSTDFLDDGQADVTSFWMTIEVPEWARSLRMWTSFTSAEFDANSARQDDRADLGLAFDGLGVALVTMHRASQSFGPEGPWQPQAIRVEGGERLRVEFVVRDAGDGALDSALSIRDAFFSSEEPPPGPIPPEDEHLSGDATPRDSLHGTIDLARGGLLLRQRALLVPAPELPFDLRLVHDFARPAEAGSPLGARWTHSYRWRAQELTSTGDVRIQRGDGSSDYFVPDGDGYRALYAGVYARLSRDPQGRLVHRDPQGPARIFDAEGRLARIETPSGVSVLLEHGPHDVLLVHDTRGNDARFEYDAAGRLTSVDYAGRTGAEFGYDALGRLVALRAPDVDQRYGYDAAGNLTTVHDASVLILTNEWELGRLVRQIDGAGHATEVVYEGEETTVLVDGVPRRTIFDGGWHPTGWIDPVGQPWEKELDGEHEVTERTNPLGHVTRTYWDGHGRPIRQVDPLGHEVLLAHDAAGNLVSLVDQAGNETRFEWDAKGRLTSRRTPLGAQILYAYDDQGRIASVTDLANAASSFAYSEDGDLELVVDVLSGETRLEHDEIGRLVSTTDALGSVTSFDYEDDGTHIRAITDALGHTTQFEHDALGRVAHEIDAAGGVTSYEHDGNGDLVRIVDREGSATEYAYDAEGRLVQRREPLGRHTSFSFDLKGQLRRVVDAEGGVALAAYDAAGNRTGQRDPNGNRATFEYDSRGQLVRLLDAGSGEERRGYDPRGLLVSVVDGRGLERKLEHDAAGQLVRMVLADEAIELSLDANGNALEISWADGRRAIRRAFDALDRVVLREDGFGNVLRYDYDALGNLTRLVYPDGRKVRYAYDALHRLRRVDDWAGRWVVYTYDALGNLSREERFDGSFVEYGYDAAQRLTSRRDVVGGVVVHAVEYELDAAGRRVSELAVLPLEPVLEPGARSLEYGSQNRLLAYDEFRSFEYDAAGNLLVGTLDGEQRVNFAYDSLNRLVRAGDATFRYDGEGLRVETTVDGETRRFVQDPNATLSRLLEEQDARGRPLVHHVYGLGLLWSEDALTGEVALHHYDVRGSTVAVSDGRGRITDRLAFDPWGRVVARTGERPLRFTYVGREGVEDDGGGLYHMRTREYAAPLMRFLQQDDLANGRIDVTQSLNRYGYGGGNPIHNVDPDGEFFNFVAQVAVGAVVGAVVNVAIVFVVDISDGKLDSGWQDYAIAAAEGAVAGAIIGINPSAGLLGSSFLGALAGGASTATGNLLQGKDVTTGLAGAGIVGALGGPLAKLTIKLKPVAFLVQKLRIQSIHHKVARYGATPSLQWTQVNLAVKKKIGAEILIERLIQQAGQQVDDKLNDLVWEHPLKELLGTTPSGRKALGEE